jgi:hypothetical protein
MTIISATPATLWTLLGKAAAGDVFECADGNYGDLKVPAKAIAEPGVIVRGGRGAVFSGLYLNGCSGYTFAGMTVNGSPAGRFSILAANGERIGLENIDNTGTGGPGIQIRGVKHFHVSGCEIAGRGLGINVMDCVDGALLGNLLHHLTGDAINPFGFDTLLIEGNTIRDAAVPAGSHGDAVQTANTAAYPRNRNLIVRGNVILQGSGVKIQGLFINGVDKVLIEANACHGTMFNGIWLGNCTDADVRDNFVQGSMDMMSNMGVRQGSSGVRFTDNVACAINDVTETTGLKNTGVTITGTASVKQADDLKALSAWQARYDVVEPPPAPVDPSGPIIADLKAQLSEALAAIAEQKTAIADLKVASDALTARLEASDAMVAAVREAVGR